MQCVFAMPLFISKHFLRLLNLRFYQAMDARGEVEVKVEHGIVPTGQGQQGSLALGTDTKKVLYHFTGSASMIGGDREDEEVRALL